MFVIIISIKKCMFVGFYFLVIFVGFYDVSRPELQLSLIGALTKQVLTLTPLTLFNCQHHWINPRHAALVHIPSPHASSIIGHTTTPYPSSISIPSLFSSCRRGHKTVTIPILHTPSLPILATNA